MQIKIIAVGSTKWEMFICRWGISYLIGQDLLFDTFGDPYVFLRNVERMNIDLSKIKHIVISHDHWDHISGLWYVINRYKDINVYICPNFDIKIKERIKSFGVNVVEVSGLLGIKDNIYSTGEIEGRFRNISISEQALVVNSENGLIVTTGCAHPGILTILKEVKKNFPDKKIFSALGGFHLLDKERKDIELIVSEFKKMGIKKVGPTHCTGKEAEEIFKDQYGENFIPIKAKEIIEI
jgi:7,8-dihydropterin-6-yl-methyl-4-(beta-D-ribofuranosyl)aminobenzene 5'-phosphate synthase